MMMMMKELKQKHSARESTGVWEGSHSSDYSLMSTAVDKWS